jgi:hypothetical protein
MPGLFRAIHVQPHHEKTSMAGTSPGMTQKDQNEDERQA